MEIFIIYNVKTEGEGSGDLVPIILKKKLIMPDKLHKNTCNAIYLDVLTIFHTIYRPRSKGDNTFGSVRLSVRPSVCLIVCLLVGALLFKPFDV